MEYVYSAMLLHAAGKPVSEENLKKILAAAGVKADDARVKALTAALEGVNIDEAIKTAVSMPTAAAPAAPAAAPEKKKEEKKEEEEKVSEEEAAAGLGALFGEPAPRGEASARLCERDRRRSTISSPFRVEVRGTLKPVLAAPEGRASVPQGSPGRVGVRARVGGRAGARVPDRVEAAHVRGSPGSHEALRGRRGGCGNRARRSRRRRGVRRHDHHGGPPPPRLRSPTDTAHPAERPESVGGVLRHRCGRRSGSALRHRGNPRPPPRDAARHGRAHPCRPVPSVCEPRGTRHLGGVSRGTVLSSRSRGPGSVCAAREPDLGPVPLRIRDFRRERGPVRGGSRFPGDR